MSDCWYNARSILLGIDQYTQSYLRAYNVAKKSLHPDALWLCKLFEETRFLERGLSLNELPNPTNDPRLLCFAHVEKRYYTKLKDNPYTFARAMYKLHVDPLCTVPDENDPMILWSKRREYLRLHRLGDRKTYRPMILDCIRRAAELGLNDAILEYSKKLHGLNKLKWIAKVVRETNGKYSSEFTYQMTQMTIPDAIEASMYWIGVGKIIDSFEKNDIYIGHSQMARHALDAYRRNRQCTKAAVDMWIHCAHRLNRNIFNCDIRKKIARLIWKSKKEGLYE